MKAGSEKRILQLVVAVACIVPLTAGGMGVLFGPDAFGGGPAIARDLDSHFRYISGIFLGVGIAFATCVPRIEERGPRFRLLGALVVLGGLARLLSLITVGVPSPGHLFGLAMELVVVPCLLAWQFSFARRVGYRV